MIDSGGFPHFRTHRRSNQLPGQMVGKIAGLGKKILERRALDFLHLAGAAVAGIEIFLEERAEIDFFERILLFDRGEWYFLREPPVRALLRGAPTSSSRGTESSSSSRTGFSTISAVIMSRSSSLLSASTLTICTRPGVRICLCETFKWSLGWRRTIHQSLVVSLRSSVFSRQGDFVSVQ